MLPMEENSKFLCGESEQSENKTPTNTNMVITQQNAWVPLHGSVEKLSSQSGLQRASNQLFIPWHLNVNRQLEISR